MRLTVTAFGLALDISIGREQCELEYDDTEPGDALSNPVGFTANHERPEESGIPYREGWE